ncbi:MAG: Na+/H+ antiporter subunit G [Spirochaetales bacterium]|nr:Na+/H+ antiporter subunit G [Spirochaetales bacterium]
MNNLFALILFIIGAVFDFFGCLGLVRFPDVYNRLQASTKCVTFGTIFILSGVAVYAGLNPMSIKAVLCIVFILITSPTAAHAISRGAHHSGIKLWKKSVVDAYEKDKPETK